MNSAWGNRAEILKYFGWTYDYLLWGIAWINVSLMMADSARYVSSTEDQGDDSTMKVRLTTKEEIKKFINGD